MKLIGVTGPSGAGKTSLSEYFSRRGIPYIDADKLYHSMLVPPSECLDAIAAVFGNEVIASDGTLDRAILGGIVFSDAEKLKLLNSTVLSIVIKEMRKILTRLKLEGHKAVIIDAPTLIESGFHKECDVVISVLSDKQRRVERIAMRDGISAEQAIERVNAQKSDEFYVSHSDTVLYNNGTEEEFLKDIDLKISSII